MNNYANTFNFVRNFIVCYAVQTVLQGMIDKLIETGKNKSNENFKTAIPSNNYDRPKTTGECEMF